MTQSRDNIYTQKAWVVFTNQTDLPWLKILRKGFRHCFVILHDGEKWLSVDPLAHRLEIQVQSVPADFDLPRWLEERGHIAIRAKLHEPQKILPLMPLTCVEVVKRVLGVRSRLVITPWQLYRHLRAERYSGVEGKAKSLMNIFIGNKGDLSWGA